MADNTELVLHVWPSPWSLPTITPTCLASVLYLQLTIPGQFIVEQTPNPDLSPDGQLPYLTHGLYTIASFPSIVKYIDGLQRRRERSEDEEDGEDSSPSRHGSMNAAQRAKQTAWMAYVSANLGDLVACHFFTLRHNYFEHVRKDLARMLPIPQRYYVPDRLRGIYKSRLEAAGLWTVSAEEAEEEKRQKRGLASHVDVQEAFGKEKVLEKARTCFDILSRLLGDKPFFLDSPNPTALDVLVAAHILFLKAPQLPNDLLSTLVTNSYPSLVAHAERVNARARNARPPSSHLQSASVSSSYDLVDVQPSNQGETVPLCIRTAPSPTFSQVLASISPPFAWGRGSRGSTKGKHVKSEEEKRFDRMRWAWFGLATLGIVAWVWSVGSRIIVIEIERPEDEGDEGEGGELEKTGEEDEEGEDEEDEHEVDEHEDD